MTRTAAVATSSAVLVALSLAAAGCDQGEGPLVQATNGELTIRSQGQMSTSELSVRLAADGGQSVVITAQNTGTNSFEVVASIAAGRADGGINEWFLNGPTRKVMPVSGTQEWTVNYTAQAGGVKTAVVNFTHDQSAPQPKVTVTAP